MCYPCSVIAVPVFYWIILQAHVQLRNHLQAGGRGDGEGAAQGAEEPALPDGYQTTAWAERRLHRRLRPVIMLLRSPVVHMSSATCPCSSAISSITRAQCVCVATGETESENCLGKNESKKKKKDIIFQLNQD